MKIFPKNFWGIKSLITVFVLTACLGILTPIQATGTQLPDDLEILTPDQLEKGMEGYGKTVFSGQTIDTFSVVVKGVLKNVMPDQDFILVKAKHPLLETTKIMSGMSGSPIFIDGKLVGALAYSWGFEREPLAGVTPIKKMFDANRNQKISDNKTVKKIRSTLATSGLHSRFQGLLEKKFEKIGVPVKTVAGGMGSSKMGSDTTSGSDDLQAGDAVGARLMSGDLGMTAIGTVTHVQNDQVYAFGHPFMNSGRIEFPMTTAKVHTAMPSLKSSFKISSPKKTVGTIDEDRQAAIVGVTGQKANMLTVNLDLNAPRNDYSRNYEVNVIKNRYLTPNLINMAAANFATSKMNQLGLNRVESKIKLNLNSGKTINLQKTSVVSGSFDPWAFLPLPNIWQNPYKKLSVESVDISMTMKPSADFAKIKDAWLSDDSLTPGETVTVFTELNPYRGNPTIKRSKIQVPEHLAGDKAKLHILPGSALIQLQAKPTSFKQMVKYINSQSLDTRLGILLQVPKLSVSARGHQLNKLPYSIAGTFRRAVRTSADYDPVSITEQLKTDWVLKGKQQLMLGISN